MMRILSRCGRRLGVWAPRAAGSRGLESAKNDLLMGYSANSAADWRLERSRAKDGYYHLPGAEEAIIAYGKPAVPIAEELLESFDHRVRCSGLTVLAAVEEKEAMIPVFVEHLDDPYGPIRWKCWQGLHEMNALPLESMPSPRRDDLGQWKRLKRACRVAGEFFSAQAACPEALADRTRLGQPFYEGNGGENRWAN